MRTPCIGCGRPIPVGARGRCSACRSPARRYRSSAAHQRDRAAALAGGAACARCGSLLALELHHVSRLADGLEAGIAGERMVLCRSCHALEHGRWRPTPQKGLKRRGAGG